MTDGEPPGERIERFRALYDAAYDDVAAYCRRRAPAAAADDALAETFTVAWRRLDDVPPPPGARPWLFGVARRVLANQRRGDQRRQRLRLRLVDDAHRHGGPGEGDPGDDSRQELTGVVGALATLSDDDQELLRLVAWEELSHAEVAVVLGCSANAVAIRLHRARRRLARALKAIDGGGQVEDRRVTPADTTVTGSTTGNEEDR